MRDPVAAAERETLLAAYGPVERLPRSSALLRSLGCDHGDAIVVRYPCVESADAFADLNRRVWGHQRLGPFVTEAGIIQVIDYSAQASRLRADASRRRRARGA